MNDPIIQAGASRPLYFRVLDIFMTALIWASYLYLLKDVFLFIAHSVVDLIHRDKIPQGSGGVLAVGKSLGSYLEVIAINSVIFIAWALYNQLMYSGRNRRKSAEPIRAEEVGAFFGLTAAEVEECRQARRLVVRHDEFGTVQGYQVGPVAPEE